jgi:hypothetical protein
MTNLSQEQIDTVFKASQEFSLVSSMVRMNPSMEFPRTQKQYEQISQDLMQIVRDAYAK